MQSLQNYVFALIFPHPLSVCHNQLTSNEAHFSNNQSYQYANIKIQISILGKPNIFISLNKLTTLNLVLLLGSVPLFPTPANVQKYFLRLREESWTHTL